MTEIISAISDPHITSTVGLCNPDMFTLDDGGQYRGSKGQRWLWRCWVDFWEKVGELDIKYGATTVSTVLVGDLIEKDTNKRSKQIVTRNSADVIAAADETLKPALLVSDRFFFVRGTAAHTGKSSEYEELLARNYDITEKTPEGKYSWWKLLAEFSGVLFDIEHHASMGQRYWTTTNAMNVLATELIIGYAGQKLPSIAIRGHNHKSGDTYDNYPIRVIALPSWQLFTEYNYRKPVTHLPPKIGGCVFVVDNGSIVEVVKLYYEPQRIRAWKKNTANQTG